MGERREMSSLASNMGAQSVSYGRGMAIAALLRPLIRIDFDDDDDERKLAKSEMMEDDDEKRRDCRWRKEKNGGKRGGIPPHFLPFTIK
ncbi:hypothetical protein PFISCL1PPCAC_27589, partial [Pristionchus fissidentatus]